MNKKSVRRIVAILLSAVMLVVMLPYMGYKGEALGAANDAVPGRLTLSDAMRPHGQRQGGTNPAAIYLYSEDEITPDNAWKQIHKPVNIGSGIWVGEHYAGGQMKKHYTNQWYAENFGTAKEGEVVTIKGTFYCADSGEYVEMEESRFRWNGEYWEQCIDEVDERERVFLGVPKKENGATSFRIIGDDAVSFDGNRTDIAIAYDGSEGSGVFYNGVDTNIPIKHAGDGTYYVALKDVGITAVKGDSITIGGIFINGAHTTEYAPAEFVYDGNKWNIVEENMEYVKFDFQGNGTFRVGGNNGVEYWDNYFTFNSNLPGEDWNVQYDDIIVKVNGVEINAIIKKAERHLMNVFFYTTEMPANPEAGTRFTICAGKSLAYTVQGRERLSKGIDLQKSYECVWDGSTWEWVKDTTWQETTITGIHKDTHKSERFWKLYLDADMSVFHENGYYVNVEIDGEMQRYFARKVSNELLYIEIPHSVLSKDRVSTVVIKGGEYLSVNQCNGCRLAQDFACYLSPYEVTMQGGSYAADVSLTLIPTAADSKNGKGFIVTTDIEDPVTPDGATWTSRIYATKGSGVYRNGVLTDRRLPMVKVVEQTYYVALQDVGLIAEKDEFFTVGGTFYSPELEQMIYIEPLTVLWNGTAWETVETNLSDTGVDSDVNADSEVNLKDLMRLKRCDKYVGIPISVAKKDVNYDGFADEKDQASLKKVLTGQLYYKEGIAYGEPEYEEGLYIERCSYASPAIDDANGRMSDEEIDASFQKYKEAGFTLVNSEFHATYVEVEFEKTQNEPLRAYLAAAQRNGVGVIVLSNYINSILRAEDMETIYYDWREEVDEIVANLSAYESFKGFMMSDELTVKRAVNYQSVAGYIKEKYPELMLFSSQLPVTVYSMAGHGTPTLTTNPEVNNTEELSYRDYIWNFAKESDVYVYDLYPLRYTEKRVSGIAYSSGYSVDDDWYRNLRYVAAERKEQKYNFEAGITIASCELHDVDTASSLSIRYAPEKKEDMGFQTYTAMAYGMESFNYFTYEPHPATDTKVMNTMTQNAAVYEAVRSVNADVDSFAHIYQSFAWRDTLDISTGEKKTTEYSKSLLWASVSGNKARAFVGCMKDKDGFDGYMIANATGPRAGITSAVTLKFAGATKAMVYANGTVITVTLTNGIYTANLGSGEGVFVIPISERKILK